MRGELNREKGITLIEMTVALSILGAVSLGLASVYVFGYRAWVQTERKMRLQQQGSLVLTEITESISRASGIEGRGNRIRVHFPASPGTGKTVASSLFRWEGTALWKNGERLVPEDWDTDLQVRDFQVEPDADPRASGAAGKLFSVRLTLRSEPGRDGSSDEEEMSFATSVFARNTAHDR